MCCTRLAANTGRKKVAKNRHLGTIAQLCRAISLVFAGCARHWAKRPHRRRTRTAQSYSPGCANVTPRNTSVRGPIYESIQPRRHLDRFSHWGDFASVWHLTSNSSEAYSGGVSVLNTSQSVLFESVDIRTIVDYLGDQYKYATGPCSCLSCLVCNAGCIVAKRLDGSDATWYGGRPRSVRHYIRWRPSCLSVTSRYCIEMATHRITQTTPYGSPGNLVF